MTGVQTCALPISENDRSAVADVAGMTRNNLINRETSLKTSSYIEEKAVRHECTSRTVLMRLYLGMLREELRVDLRGVEK